MNKTSLLQKIKQIVSEANNLKDKYTKEKDVLVNWVCIFSQSDAEYEKLTKQSLEIGDLIETTSSGLIYKFKDPPETEAGRPKLFKIRMYDKTRPEKGDADFTTKYEEFKKTYLDNKRFTLIVREKFEMIELKDENFDVRAYFSSIPPSILRKIKV